MSANHLQDYDRAIEIIHAAKEAGADAIKLQTYTADTMTVDSDADCFINKGGLWDGIKEYDLYKQAYTPWEWHAGLMEEAKKCGLLCFSSPFDATAVDFLEELDAPAYKIASYEINDIPLIRRVAKLHKPVIFATGIAHLEDIERAMNVCREEGNEDVILLKCVSAYPTPYEDVNLRMIPTLSQTFGCLTGLSDHTIGGAVAAGAVSLGARMVEKHLTLKRSDGGPDGAFSMEPQEFKEMVSQIRILEKALGSSEYRLTPKQEKNGQAPVPSSSRRTWQRAKFSQSRISAASAPASDCTQCIMRKFSAGRLPVRSERGRRCHGISSVSLYPHRRK